VFGAYIKVSYSGNTRDSVLLLKKETTQPFFIPAWRKIRAAEIFLFASGIMQKPGYPFFEIAKKETKKRSVI
jgi:hypothetical protein